MQTQKPNEIWKDPQDSLFEFHLKEHLYFYDRIQIPSVTQLLQEFGLLDLSKVPDDRLEHKRIIGVFTHLACAYYDLGRLDENTVDPAIAPFLLAYIKFKQVTKFKANFIELRMRSKKYRFAGTLDRQGEFKGPRDIIDLKCTYDMYPSTGPQIAGYDVLFNENHGAKATGRFGLLLKETQNFEVFEFQDPKDYNDILSCNYLHHRKDKIYGTGNGQRIDAVEE